MKKLKAQHSQINTVLPPITLGKTTLIQSKCEMCLEPIWLLQEQWQKLTDKSAVVCPKCNIEILRKMQS